MRNSGGGFHHVAIRVRDFDGAVRFYRDALGFTEKLAWGEGYGRAILLDMGDGACLEIFAGGDGDAAILHFSLRSDDVDADVARAAAAGAEVTMEPKDVDIPTKPAPTPVRIAFCRAPTGEVIEFFHERGS